MSKQSTMMYTDWCLTVFDLDSVIYMPDLMVYCCYQKECCPETSKLHLQCFVIFKVRKRFDTVKLLFPTAHIEKRQGTRVQARDYCQKEVSRMEPPLVFGVWPEDSISKRIRVTDLLKETTVLQVIDQEPSLWRNFKVLTALRCSVAEPRKFLTSGLLLSGLTGCGKSLTALLVSAFLGSVYYVDPTLKWFDGYDGQDVIVVDEFRGCPISFLLRMLDRYPMLLPVKGSMVQMLAKTVIFTSNLTFHKMFKYLDILTYNALRRRLVEIKFN